MAAQISLSELANVASTQEPLSITHKTTPRKEVDPSNRCCARVWGTGSGNDQCTKAQSNGNDYCKAHTTQHASCPEPCQLDADGKRLGLFTGDIRHKLTGADSSGKWVITWNDETLQAQMAGEKETGVFEFHPWAPNSGRLALAKKGGNKATKPKITKIAKADKPKIAKADKPKIAKPKRAKTPYFCFVGEHRDDIKQSIQGGDPTAKVSQPQIAKEAGSRWKLLDPEAREPYVRLSSEDKAAKIALFAQNHDSNSDLSEADMEESD